MTKTIQNLISKFENTNTSLHLSSQFNLDDCNLKLTPENLMKTCEIETLFTNIELDGNLLKLTSENNAPEMYIDLDECEYKIIDLDEYTSIIVSMNSKMFRSRNNQTHGIKYFLLSK